MFRKSAIALAFVLLTLSYRLNALGLGEIDMQSALNQPMKADISLISVGSADLTQVKVTLASRQSHERLGLSRAKVLSSFKFGISEDSNGIPVIHISSFEPVREPYLEFLLEMVWENGRIVREYTVLVDPPVTMSAPPVTPVAPVVRAPEPVISEPTRRARPVPAPKPAAATFAPDPVQKTAETYGPIRRDEALWGISRRLRPDGDISIQQMMLALQRANPHAFTNNNINNLKAGATLTVPDRAAILALNKNQARAEAGRQYSDWQEQRSSARPAAEGPVASVPATETAVTTGTEAKLKLTPPEGDPVAGSASSIDTGDTGSEASGGGDIRQQLALASEEAEAGRAQSEELQSRVLELEAQIENMQRLLELKSDELAGMQNRAGMAETEAATEEAIAGEEDRLAADAGAVEVNAETETADPLEAEAETEPDVAEDTVAFPPAVEPRGFADRLMDNPLLAGLGVLIAMLLGGFLWGSMRKQSSQSMFDEEMTLDKHLSGAGGEASGSDRRAMNISDPGRFDEAAEDKVDDVPTDAANDPVTEADVYLAYGRIQQAEDVLQAALGDDPENVAVRAKLLRVYHAAGNVAAFDSTASEYRQSIPENDDQWERIAAMGAELSPENELYRSTKKDPGETDSVVEFDMDLSGLDDMSAEVATTGDSIEGDPGLNVKAEASETGGIPESLEFTLDDTSEDDIESEGLLENVDEVATKLDLARAYLDMEDPEGARSILKEVIEEGNEEQKSEAESLISNIA